MQHVNEYKNSFSNLHGVPQLYYFATKPLVCKPRTFEVDIII